MMITFATISVAIGVAIAVTLGKSLSNQVALVVRQNERIADGDFSPNKNLLLLPARTEFGHLINTQETMRTKLIAALEEVRASAFQVNSSALELASTSEQVATSVQRQADSTAAASATLEELSVSIDHVSENANDASRQASQAGKLTEQGASNVRDSVACIDSVHDSVRQTCDEMATLKEEVTNIGNIVTVIREVADQTNLLALNAAIEAARAGESGRGFAVVADEVRKLAERTTNSAQEITQMIHSIQGKSERVVSSMTGSQQSVGGATESADKTRTIIGEVQRGAGEALGAISKINTALSEQRLASQNLAKTMETVAQLAEENSATVEELAANSRTLMDLSGSMRQVVERFRW
jgi:methyl-accepting chemotaxis protein